MIINKHNYEIYALDYLEGNLDAVQAKAMNNFLNAHPIIKAELDQLLSLPVVQPDMEIQYEHKRQLLKRNRLVVPLRGNTLRRVVAIAVAIVLLLMTYFTGYFFGHQQMGQETIVKYIEVSSPTSNSENIATTAISKTVEKETVVVEKVVYVDRPVEVVQTKPTVTTTVETKAMPAVTAAASLEEVAALTPLRKRAFLPIESTQPPIIIFDELENTDVINLAWQSTKAKNLGRIKQYVNQLAFDQIDKEAFVPSYFAGE